MKLFEFLKPTKYRLHQLYLLVFILLFFYHLPARADLNLINTIGEASLFDSLNEMALNKKGDVYILDGIKNKVYHIDANGKYVQSIPANFYKNIAVNNQNELYFREYKSIRKTKNGKLIKNIKINVNYTGSSDHAADIAIDDNGLIYLNFGKNIYIYDKDLVFLKKIEGYSSTNANFIRFGLIKSLKFNNNHLIVEMLKATVVLNQQNQLIKSVPVAMLRKLAKPTRVLEDSYDLAFDKNGFGYLVDQDCNCIKKFDDQGNIIQTLGGLGNGRSQFYLPNLLALNNNQLIISDAGNFRLQKIDLAGNQLWSIGDEPTKFKNPSGLALDSLDNIYILDQGHARVLKYSSNGTWLTSWGVRGYQTGQLATPMSIRINPLDDRVYIQDSYKTGDKLIKRTQIFNSEGIFLGAYEPYLPAFDKKGNTYYLFLKDRTLTYDDTSSYEDTYLLQKIDLNLDPIQNWVIKGGYQICLGIGCFINYGPIDSSIILDENNNIYYLNNFNHSLYGPTLSLHSTTASVPVDISYLGYGQGFLATDKRNFIYMGSIYEYSGNQVAPKIKVFDASFDTVGSVYLNSKQPAPLALATDKANKLYLLNPTGLAVYSPVSNVKAPKLMSVKVINAQGSVKLVWKDNSSDESGFKIKSCREDTTNCSDQEATILKIVSANRTSVVLPGVATVGSNVTKTFRITAFKGNEESLVSNEIAVNF